MKPRVLAILAAITGLVLLIAILATRGTGTPATTPRAADHTSPTRVGEHLFPDLRANADNIVALRVSQADASAHIVRDPGTSNWRVATLGGYPANPDRVRDTVRSIVDAKVLDIKTTRRESHAAIGLESPANAGARSILVEAFDAQGSPMARLILGDIAPSATTTFDPSATSRFVRRADEDQTYLVAGRFPADPSPTAWVVRSILEIPASRVRQVRIAHPDGHTLIASREDQSRDVTLQDIPQGRTVSDPVQVSRLAQALAFLTLDSVRPAGDAESLGGFEAATTFDLITFDHLLIRAHVIRVADEFWSTLQAMPEPIQPADRAPATSRADGSVSAPAANTEISIDDPMPEEPKDRTPSNPPTSANSTDLTDEPSRAAAREQADALNARFAPWIFRLTPTKGEQLTLTLEDVLTPSPIQGPALPAAEDPQDPSPAPQPAPLPATPATQPQTDPGIDPAKVLFPDSRN